LALARQRGNDCPTANISSFPNSWVIPNNPAFAKYFQLFGLTSPDRWLLWVITPQQICCLRALEPVTWIKQHRLWDAVDPVVVCSNQTQRLVFNSFYGCFPK